MKYYIIAKVLQKFVELLKLPEFIVKKFLPIYYYNVIIMLDTNYIISTLFFDYPVLIYYFNFEA